MVSQTSAQSKFVRMHVVSSATMTSLRQASAQSLLFRLMLDPGSQANDVAGHL